MIQLNYSSDPTTMLAMLQIHSDEERKEAARSERAGAIAEEMRNEKERIDAMEDQADARFAGAVLGCVGQTASGAGQVVSAFSSRESSSSESGEESQADVCANEKGASGGQRAAAILGSVQGEFSFAAAWANSHADGEGVRVERLELKAKAAKAEGDGAADELRDLREGTNRFLGLVQGVEEARARAAEAAVVRG